MVVRAAPPYRVPNRSRHLPREAPTHSGVAVHTTIRVALAGAVLLAGAVACGQSTPQAVTVTKTITSVSTVTTTLAPTSQTATATATTPTLTTTSSATTTTTTESKAINSVEVVPRKGNGIVTEVGPGLYQLPTYPSGINPPEVTFDWTAHGPSEDITSSGCTVVADVT